MTEDSEQRRGLAMEAKLKRLRINAERFRRQFDALARIGASPEGGIHRTALGEADAKARAWLQEQIDASGLAYACDPAGNQSALLAGADRNAPRFLLGSHLDTVPDGGCFDGALGVLAAMEVLLTLQDAGYTPPFDLEAINFTDEEGTHIGTLGSRALIGRLSAEDLQNPFQGLPAFEAGLARIGLASEGLMKAGRPGGQIGGFLELHIEQGPVLDNAGVAIGIVTAIVGIGRLTLVFRGRADHAGTTPMALRRDPGKAAGVFAAGAEQVLDEAFPDCVLNIGDMRFQPGAFNVVPHTVELDLEYRAPDDFQLESLQAALVSRARTAARKYQVTLDVATAEISPAATMSTAIQDALVYAANRMRLSFRRMLSGAGHDAQNLADVCPTGMIFVPSVKGRSHNPEEYSRWNDCLQGANLLLQAVLEVIAAASPYPPGRERIKNDPSFVTAAAKYGNNLAASPNPEMKGESTMAPRKKKAARDIEKGYPARQFVAKLRRLADCIEQGKRFRIQVAGERISVPPDAVINIEHEREGGQEEVEFQIKWSAN